jgi:hypothetical protein
MIQPSGACQLRVSFVAAVMLAGCADKPAPPAAAASPSLTGKSAVRAVHARCVAAMVRSACIAAKDASTSPPPSSPVVMLAGVGAVDARFYAALRAAGDGMCEMLVQPCDKSWDGPQCRTARALWAAP